MNVEDNIVNWETRHKILEENLFADMIVMVGRYMEYKIQNPIWNQQEFIKYYKKRNSNVIGRCMVQAYVIKQAKKYYEDNGEYRDITYSKVRRMFRRNIKIFSYSLDYEQYYFWEFVMNYIIENNDGLLDIILKEVIKECEYYSSNEDTIAPYADCLQKMLDWYYVCLKMKKGIWNKGIADEMLLRLKEYKNFSKFKKNCRIYMKTYSDI